MHERRVRLKRVHVVQYRRQWFVFNLDRLHRCPSLFQRFGRNGGYGLAVMAHFTLGQNILVYYVEADVVIEFLAGDHGPDAGHRGRLGRIDALDARARVRAFLELGVEHARYFHVTDEHCLAGELLDHVRPAGLLADVRQVVGLDVIKHARVLPSRLVARSSP